MLSNLLVIFFILVSLLYFYIYKKQAKKFEKKLVDCKKEFDAFIMQDLLTGVGNRNYAKISLGHELSQAKRHDYPLSLVLMDIDSFKDINQKHTHEKGDEILIEYSKLISEVIREGDIFCRISGDEFLLILPDDSLDDARKTAEKIRMTIQMHQQYIPVSMTFGVIEYNKNNTEEENFQRLQSAHTKAKQEDVDCIQMA